MNNTKKLALLLCASSACGLYAQSASAQTAAAARPAAGMQLEELIVTARRTEEQLQQVPVAVTALTQSGLDEKGIRNYQDLQYAVPSLTFSQTVSRDSNRLTIRGQTQAYQSPLPSVETLFAEVPQTSSGANQPLYDLQSIQVLKGPQGVAFGRNSTGGAVLITPQRPKYQFEGYLEGMVGNFQARTAEAVVNIPIIADKLAVRGSFHSERREGWTKNLTTGTLLDNKHLDSLRLSVLFQPTESLENLTVVTYQAQNQTGTSNHMLAYNPAGQVGVFYRNRAFYPGPLNIDAEAARAIAGGRDVVYNEFDGYLDVKSVMVANTTIFKFTDNLRVKNILAVQRNSGDGMGTDMDGTPLRLIVLGNNRQLGKGPETQRLTDEVQVQGDAMDGQLRWLAGLFYLKDKQVKGGKPSFSATLQDLVITRGSTPTLTVSDNSFESVAPYGQVTAPLSFITNGLSLTVGARHTVDTVTESTLNYVGAAATCSPATCIPIPRSAKFKGWGYAVTADWRVNDDTLVYLAHRHGYKGGGFNRIQLPPSEWIVNPEHVDDIEGGLKADYHVGGMAARTNLAVYNQWYKDIVRSQFVFIGGAAFNVNRNVGKATIRGVEIEQTLIPTDQLRLQATYSYTDAYLTDTGGVPAPYKRFPDVPKTKVTLSATLDLPVADNWGNIAVSGIAAYQSRRAGDQNAVSDFSFQKAYTLFNARVDWRDFMRTGVDVDVFVKNLTDKKYVLAGGDFYVASSLGFVQGLYGEPRTYGLELRYAFGGK
ncbi:MAG: TonB-dependent receptor [Phenylobacterium sp.]|nr:TonB-dependent receptor [Phenylobacterium sp.]